MQVDVVKNKEEVKGWLGGVKGHKYKLRISVALSTLVCHPAWGAKWEIVPTVSLDEIFACAGSCEVPTDLTVTR